ncbi:MAG: hypothetical protein LBT66_08720 [Methanobrevibacter sp.]|jgi:hypothetical protein|nr:hypothetical protein [Candidatus Methanovirga meridionalis]
MGLDDIYDKSTPPKETSRQMGSKFQSWINKGFLGADILDTKQFLKTSDNAVLRGSDSKLTLPI